ncbi:MFS transporter [Actinoallomurus sp. CA-150999]|uniref:MFS transporter n=1 Tax=Actinoallomurus sp. CA-150999 TaxID=3239887 RepID=UPI003D93AC3E
MARTTVEPAVAKEAPAWTMLLLACLGSFMIVMDVVVISVALPDIGSDLGFSPSDLPWTINAYTLTFAGFLLAGGRAADVFGLRRTLLTGLAVFTVSRLAAGFAQDPAMLLTCRAVQGLGAAVLMPATLTLIMSAYPEGARRARALAIWSGVGSVGASAGSVIGGVVTDAAGWRWIFFMLVPVGVAGLLLGRHAIPAPRGAGIARRSNLLGGTLITPGLVALVYGMVSTKDHGWTGVPTLGSFAVAVVLIVLFAVQQARWAKDPLVPVHILKRRSVAGGNLVVFLLGIGFFSYPYFLSLYLENVLGYSALRTGVASLPVSVGVLIGAQLSGRSSNRYGVRPVAAFGAAVTAIGLLGLAGLDAHSAYLTGVCLPGVLVGLGTGLAITPITMAATSGVPPTSAGVASGLFNTTRQVSGAVGLALLATVAATPAGSGGAQAAGYSRAFFVAACFAALATLGTPLLQHAARELETGK